MSRPNTRNDPQAPLLTGDRELDDAEEDSHSGIKKIRIFNKNLSLFHLTAMIIGLLALIAIGISIVAIGTFSCLGLPIESLSVICGA